MGCCCSQDNDEAEFREPTERTRLVSNAPTDATDGRPAVLVSSQPPPTRPTGNETLAQILDRSANAYIDVNAVDSSRMRSHSYSTKCNRYSERINSSTSMHSAVKSPIHLPFGVTSHTAVLNEPILAKGDIETIIATSDALNAELENIKPRVKEPLATFMP